MRRALGFKLISQGRTLMGFITYAEGAGATVITAGIALDWARPARGEVNPAYWAQRLGVVRVFTLHLQTLDPATQIPPAGLLPWRPRRITPYVYSPGEITLLLEAASRLRPRLRAATWHSVLALLTVTGMRVSEVCALDRDDVDLDHGILTVRESKGISRDIPLHPSTAAALGGYARLRDRLRPAPANPAFFISTRGTRLDASNMPRVFRGLLTTAGIRQPPGQRRPRMHDLRHVLHRDQPGQVVPGRGGRAGKASAADHLPRPRRPRMHLLVLLRFPGYSDTCSLARVMGLRPGMTCSLGC
jgi:integrase